MMLQVRHLHLRAFPDFHAHTDGIRTDPHVLRHVHRVRAAGGHIGRQGVRVRALGDGHGHTTGVARALARRGVRLVVGVGQLHLVAAFDGLVRGDTRQHDFRRGHRAAASAGEHVARADHLAGLVQKAQRIGLVRALADFIELQGGAVGGCLLVYLGRHALAAHRVRRVLVHRLVNLHHRDVQAHHALAVRGQLIRGRAFRHPDFLDGVTAAVTVPSRSGQEGRHVRSLEAVVQPFAGGCLEGYHHAGLVLVGNVGICQNGHGGFLRVVAGTKRMKLRHVVEAASASPTARLHQVAVLVAPYIERVAADICLVLQQRTARAVQEQIRRRDAGHSPVVVKLAAHAVGEHLLALYIYHGSPSLDGGRGLYGATVHKAGETGRSAVHGGLSRVLVLCGGLLGLASRLVGRGSCGTGGVLGFRGRTGRRIGCLGGRIGGLRGGVGRSSRIRGGFLEQRHRYVYQFVPFHARQGIHPVQRGYRFQLLYALALRLDGVEHLLYVFL